MATTATLEPTSLRLDPGSQGIITVTVRNDSAIVESYRFEVIGSAAAWATVEPAKVTVYPGKSEVAVVRLSPPKAPTTTPGEIAFGLRVIPSEQPDDIALPEGTISVRPFVQTTAELTPRMSRGGTGARVRAAVDNRGNAPVLAQLSASDPGELLDISAEPPSFTVDPGAAAFSELRLRPRKRIWRGTPLTHQFSVTLQQEEQAPITLDGTYLQQPVVPKWVIAALLGLLGLLAAAVVLWFTVFKPVIESTAKSAVSESVQQAQDSAEQAAESAKDAAEANGQQVTTLENRVATTIRLTVSANPRTGASSDAFTVPADATLRITDVVFSNPQGDLGSLALVNGGANLFTLGLENFRDIDYHFQTPLELPAGASIAAQVQCAEPGSALGTAQRQCNETIVISALIVTAVPAPAE